MPELSARVESEDDDELVRAWRALAQARGDAFASPEWFAAWRPLEPAGTTSHVVVCRDEAGDVRGVLPLVRRERARIAQLRRPGGAFVDLFAPACATADETLVGAALATPLRGGTLSLRHVERGATWLRVLLQSDTALRAVRDRSDVLPFVELGCSWETYLASRSHNLRGQLRRKRRALERDHGARFRLCDDAARVEGDVETFLRLHALRRAHRGGSSLASPAARAGLHRLARGLFPHGWLRLWILELNGTPAAALYGWHVGNRYSYYSAGFDPAAESLSVGLVLLARTIEHAAETGAATYELLLGGEAYKYRFATGERVVERLVVTRAHHPARAVAAAEAAARRLVRRLPRSLRGAVHNRLGTRG